MTSKRNRPQVALVEYITADGKRALYPSTSRELAVDADGPIAVHRPRPMPPEVVAGALRLLREELGLVTTKLQALKPHLTAKQRLLLGRLWEFLDEEGG